MTAKRSRTATDNAAQTGVNAVEARHLVTEHENGTWSIKIPEWQTLSDRSADMILERVPRSDPESFRRNRMALDADVIRQVRNTSCAFLSIDEWQNKTLSFRTTTISLEEHDAEPIHESDYSVVGSNPSEVFDQVYMLLERRSGPIGAAIAVSIALRD
jgi:hypothetical protein